MPKCRKEPGNGRRQTGVVRGRRALNAFRIDKEDILDKTPETQETLEQIEDGLVKSEDDEDIDSDEAFDESDEERFSTFKFSGSSSKDGTLQVGRPSNDQMKGRLRKPEMDEQSEEDEREPENDDNNEQNMDLSAMLDNGKRTDKVSKLKFNGY